MTSQTTGPGIAKAARTFSRKSLLSEIRIAGMPYASEIFCRSGSVNPLLASAPDNRPNQFFWDARSNRSPGC